MPRIILGMLALAVFLAYGIFVVTPRKPIQPAEPTRVGELQVPMLSDIVIERCGSVPQLEKDGVFNPAQYKECMGDALVFYETTYITATK